MGGKRKIVAVASTGGHWMQLRKLAAAFPQDTIWVSTNRGHQDEVPLGKFRYVPDANRWNKLKLAWSAACILLLVLINRPTHVVTTGAAPGWFMIFYSRLLGAKTLWIDSFANAEALSLSGSQACRWSTEVWTQWPDLAAPAKGQSIEVQFRGSVL